MVVNFFFIFVELQTDIKTQEASANIVEPSKNNATLMPEYSSCHSFETAVTKSIETGMLFRINYVSPSSVQ
jgi:hypothetical protein